MRMVLRSRYNDCLGTGRSWEWIPVRATFFFAQPDRGRGLPSLLYSEYRVKGSGGGVHQPSQSSAEVAHVLAVCPQRPLHAYIGMAWGDLYLCLYFAMYSVATRATRYELNSLGLELH